MDLKKLIYYKTNFVCRLMLINNKLHKAVLPHMQQIKIQMHMLEKLLCFQAFSQTKSAV